MLQNPILLRAFDRDWTLQNVAFALSLTCLLIAGMSLTYLLIRDGRTRALTDKELQTLGGTLDGNPVRMQWAGAKGVRVETRIGIDGMRRGREPQGDRIKTCVISISCGRAWRRVAICDRLGAAARLRDAGESDERARI